MDAVHTATETHTMERGFSSQLIGVEQGFIGHLSLIEECAGPGSYEPYCVYALGPETPEDPFFEDHDQCSQLGCEDELVGTATMYWTMRPEIDPAERHVFTYETTSPAGQAVADPNPLLVWRYDLTTPDSVTVTSDLDRALVVTPTGGEAITLDHTGTVSVTQVEQEPTGAEVSLTFPALMAEGSVSLELTLDASAGGSGALVLGDAAVATIGGTFAFDRRLVFDWCSSP